MSSIEYYQEAGFPKKPPAEVWQRLSLPLLV
jgi:hypothetical protein